MKKIALVPAAFVVGSLALVAPAQAATCTPSGASTSCVDAPQTPTTTVDSTDVSDNNVSDNQVAAASGSLPNTGGPDALLLGGAAALLAAGGATILVSRRRQTI
jgi:LPXTG-motif cell wall-anchored protein